ncbi:MAG: hypothetical protein JMN24_04840 [gamma proteobacterium endosymbiont of Lamellibrachia anaximandri]|nr:hypothetical protein [gamma proteobacterium endosymbiont of Lamellibrachia anaximandri]MBL3619647.1 hypothetical protein [gamma proteobacterium endosymbiont of Lamellibrachia anaximandri]
MNDKDEMPAWAKKLFDEQKEQGKRLDTLHRQNEQLHKRFNEQDKRLDEGFTTIRYDIAGMQSKITSMQDRMSMLETQTWANSTGAFRPEPQQFAPTGEGLIDPITRWKREHPFRR